MTALQPPPGITSMSGVAVVSDTLFFGSTAQIIGISMSSGELLTSIGSTVGFSDGVFGASQFTAPYDLCSSPDGTLLFISDYATLRIANLSAGVIYFSCGCSSDSVHLICSHCARCGLHCCWTVKHPHGCIAPILWNLCKRSQC